MNKNHNKAQEFGFRIPFVVEMVVERDDTVSIVDGFAHPSGESWTLEEAQYKVVEAIERPFDHLQTRWELTFRYSDAVIDVEAGECSGVLDLYGCREFGTTDSDGYRADVQEIVKELSNSSLFGKKNLYLNRLNG